MVRSQRFVDASKVAWTEKLVLWNAILLARLRIPLGSARSADVPQKKSEIHGQLSPDESIAAGPPV